VAELKPMPDQAQRDAALDPRRSFIVQAPAGSGKTELLVRRFLKLLSTVQRPEEILAITFTKEGRLRRCGNACWSACRTRARSRTAFASRPSTAFCTALTRQVPVLARFGAQPEIVEDARELYLESGGARLSRSSIPASEKLLAHLATIFPRRPGSSQTAEGSRPLAT